MEYLSTFTPGFWRNAVQQVRRTRQLALAALICALTIVISSVYIPVGSNLRVYFTFLFLSLGTTVYGPVMGILVGVVSDLLGFAIHPSGAFFPGYTLSAALGGLCYGMLLYRHRMTILRLLLAKAIVNYAINVLLGSLWSAMLYSKGYYYYFTASLLKNSLLLPVEVLTMAALFRILLPQLARLQLIPPLPGGKRVIPLI